MYSQYRFRYNTPAGKRYIHWVLAKIINSKISVTRLEEKDKESFADIPVKIKTNSHWKVTTNLKKLHDREKLQEFLIRRKKEGFYLFSWSCHQYPRKPTTGGWHPRFLKFQEKESGRGQPSQQGVLPQISVSMLLGFLTLDFSLWIHLPLSVMHALPWTCHSAWEANKDQIHHSQSDSSSEWDASTCSDEAHTHIGSPSAETTHFGLLLREEAPCPKHCRLTSYQIRQGFSAFSTLPATHPKIITPGSLEALHTSPSTTEMSLNKPQRKRAADPWHPDGGWHWAHSQHPPLLHNSLHQLGSSQGKHLGCPTTPCGSVQSCRESWASLGWEMADWGEARPADGLVFLLRGEGEKWWKARNTLGGEIKMSLLW